MNGQPDTANRDRTDKRCITSLAGGWVALREPKPKLDGALCSQLLAAQHELASNLRITRTGGSAELIGEVHIVDEDMSFAEATRRLIELADGVAFADAGHATEEIVTSVLSQKAASWQRRETAWVISAVQPGAPEILVTPVDAGVRVDTQIASWDTDLHLGHRQAISCYLCLAQTSVRFARFVLSGKEVRASSMAFTDRLDRELPDAMDAVVAAWRLMHRELLGLLVPELAADYMAIVLSDYSQTVGDVAVEQL